MRLVAVVSSQGRRRGSDARPCFIPGPGTGATAPGKRSSQTSVTRTVKRVDFPLVIRGQVRQFSHALCAADEHVSTSTSIDAPVPCDDHAIFSPDTDDATSASPRADRGVGLTPSDWLPWSPRIPYTSDASESTPRSVLRAGARDRFRSALGPATLLELPGGRTRGTPGHLALDPEDADEIARHVRITGEQGGTSRR